MHCEISIVGTTGYHVPPKTQTTPGQTSAVRELESRVADRSLSSGLTAPGAVAPDQSRRPLSFQFQWRDRRFVASLINRDDGASRIAITSHVGGGDGDKRGATTEHSLVFALATHAGSTTADLKLIRGQEVVLSDSFTLKNYAGLSVDNFVAKLTAALLMSAPYLDLLSESTDSAAA